MIVSSVVFGIVFVLLYSLCRLQIIDFNKQSLLVN